MFDQRLLEEMRACYNSGATRSYSFRKEQLQKLRAAILKYEEEMHQALFSDLKKNPEESWITETGFVLSEISTTLKHLKEWMQPEIKKTNLLNIPAKSYVLKEPLGVVLIIGPWNYPMNLLFTPLVGAIAAGNCSVLKSSEFAPASSAVMKRIIQETFPSEYILFTEGDGATVVPQLIEHFRFDHIFYTGSTPVGRLVYKMAAEQLVPVTLELGGKSPCVVESDADIKVAAKRIALSKFNNAGQQCVAPDYILIHHSIKEKFIEKLKSILLQFFSDNAENCYHYGKIINEKQFTRLIGYLKDATVIYGGKSDLSKLFIEPTILDNVQLNSAIMKEEIFGPILPIISFNTMEEAKSIIDQNPNPLAFYVYTSGKAKEHAWTDAVSFGGGCINNSSFHLTNHNLPFGGRGNSGIGQYHGKNSFETFTHKKAIMKTPTWFDPSVKYPPFKGKLKFLKWIIG